MVSPSRRSGITPRSLTVSVPLRLECTEHVQSVVVQPRSKQLGRLIPIDLPTICNIYGLYTLKGKKQLHSLEDLYETVVGTKNMPNTLSRRLAETLSIVLCSVTSNRNGSPRMRGSLLFAEAVKGGDLLWHGEGTRFIQKWPSFGEY